MLRSLYGRLAVVFVALVSAIGVALLFSVRYTIESYQQEVTQRLNRDLAGHIVAEEPLMRDGQVDQATLEALFHHVMVINPAVEVYLLDANGLILAFSAPPEKVQRRHVALAPVRSFIEGQQRLPLAGDDPRNPDGTKVFSAAPIGPAEAPQGYVYAILAGEQYDNIAALARGSYVARTGILLLGAILIFALAAGLLLFFLMTRRLAALTRSVETFRDKGFREPIGLRHPGGGDEIARLHAATAEMSRRLAEQIKTLEITDQMRRELVANVSHDLRTPLAAMRGYLETLQIKDAEMSAVERRRYLGIAVQHSDRLGKLVGELFELARLDANEVKLNLESFSPAELVQDVAQSFAISARQRNVRLETALNPQAPFVRADIALIQRALGNLMENALRHTPAGGVVRVSLSLLDRHVRVEVADTGRGILPGDLPHVFLRSYRGHNDARPQTDGAGLGLAIVKRILELHEAPIEVESAPGQGARFAFKLRADPRPRDTLVTNSQ